MIQTKQNSHDFQPTDYFLKSNLAKHPNQSFTVKANFILLIQGSEVKYATFEIEYIQKMVTYQPIKEFLFDHIDQLRCSQIQTKELDLNIEYLLFPTCFKFANKRFLCSNVPPFSIYKRNLNILNRKFRGDSLTDILQFQQNENYLHQYGNVKRYLATPCNPSYYYDPILGCQQCDNSKCLECSNLTTCTKCIAGKYLNTSLSTCDNCDSTKCLECSDLTTCTKCIAGKYLNINLSTCDDCDNTKCLECSDLNTCTKCVAGKYLDNNNCMDCDLLCKECDIQSNKCTACNDGYYLEINECKICDSNCLTCQNTSSECKSCQAPKQLFTNLCDVCDSLCLTCSTTQTTCTSCYDGYVFDNVSTCLQCNAECGTCQNTTDNCLTCSIGYFQQQDIPLVCMQCHPSCLTCEISSSNCTTCRVGYYLIDNTCQQCEVSCQTCDQQFMCTTCFDGYYLEPVYKRCLGCENKCKTCVDTAQKCTSCYDGFFIDQNSVPVTCSTCSFQNNCKTCNLSADICTSCYDGYYLDKINNVCTLCDPTCTTCTNSSTECHSCLEGYYLSGTSCLKCNDLCKTCVNNSTECTSCYDNYSFDSANHVCLICDNECKQCNGLTKACTQCFDGYTLIVDQCIQCQFPCKHCSNNNKDFCDTCYQMYYLDTSNNTCLACSDNCESCTDGANCTNCQAGYFLDANNSCIKCDSICKTCSSGSNICESCYDGYYLDTLGQTCTQCIIGCKKCNDGTTCLINECSSSYYYDSINQYCTKCQYPCFKCNETTCTLCDEGYYIDSSGLCQSCSPRSKSCDSNGSISCYEGYFLDSTSTPTKCTPCDPNCKACSTDAITCTSCYPNFQLDTFNFPNTCQQTQTCTSCGCEDSFVQVTNNQCVKCGNNCQACSDTDPTQCITCYPPYIKTNSGKCIPNYCDPITEQYDIANDVCQCLPGPPCINLCSSSYYQDSITPTSCIKCQYPCFKCNDATTCTLCDDGYYIDLSGQCQSCSPGCKTCDSNGCISCQDGQFLDSTNTPAQCKPCDPICKTCSTDAITCTSCFTTSFLLNTLSTPQTCELITQCDPYFCTSPSPPCTCDLTKNICGRGEPFANFTNNICVRCGNNCQQCSNVDQNECTLCYSPYIKTDSKKCVPDYCDLTIEYFDPTNEVCQLKCSPGCIECSSNSVCTKCADDTYFLKETQISPSIIECYPCKYPCKKCLADGTCTNCVYGFTLNGSGQCLPVQLPCIDVDSNNQCNNCPSKFYLDTTLDTCKPCKYICTECDSETVCRSCIPGYFLDSSNICQPCSFYCATCTDATTCSECFDQHVTRKDIPNCECADHYFQIANLSKCTECDPVCKKCIREANNCIECDTAAFRELVLGGKCECMQGYFEKFIPVRECVPCHSNCEDCFGPGANECLSCKNGLYLNPLFTNCQCGEGFYEDSSGVCQQCFSGCSQCIDGISCLQCGQNMDLAADSLSCSCQKGYHQNGSQCEQCDVAFCEDCVADKSQCMKCFFGVIQTIPISQCSCVNIGTDQFESNLISCSRCHFSCATCNGFEANNCLTCPQTRQFNTATFTCSCKAGTYEDDATQSCQPCHYSCKMCIGPYDNECIDCLSSSDSHRMKVLALPSDPSFKCECQSGYYDVAQQQNCQQCHYTCLTCIGKDNNCQTCPSSSFRVLSSINTCICPSGYYDDGLNQSCQKCHYSCKTCINNQRDGCLECPDNSQRLNVNQITYIPGTPFSCTCMTAYYDDGINPICKSCHYSCKNCIGSTDTDCIECEDVNLYKRSFVVVSPSTTPPTGKCSCISGYLENNNQVACSKCPFPCDTCNQQKECLTCNSTRDLTNKTCACKQGYLEVGNIICQNCSSLCQQCEGTIYTCLKCNTVDHFRVINEEYQCNCKDGYYDLSVYNPSTNIPITEQAACQPCQNKCKTCGAEDPSICFTCFTVYNYILNSEKICQCMFGFIEEGNVCNETFLIENEYIDQSKVQYFKDLINLLLRILKYLSWAHLLMNQPFQSLIGFRIFMTLIFINFTNIKVNKILQVCVEQVKDENPFSIFNFMKFITPSQSDQSLRKILNKRLFLDNQPLSFLQNGQGYFFLFIIIFVIYFALKYTLLRNSILLSSKIYKKQKWRYQVYLIHHNHIFPFFMTLMQVLMMMILYFGLIEIMTTYDLSQIGSILSLIGLSIYGIAYLIIFIILYQLKYNENSKIRKYFEYDLKKNNPYFYFLQFSIDVMIIVYHAVYAQDFKQQTIIIILGFLTQGFFILIQKPFKYWWENIIDFIMYSSLSAMIFVFQQTSQLTLIQLMNEEKYRQFNTYSFSFNYTLCVSIICGIVSISIRIIKGLIRAGNAIKTIRHLKESETALWELEMADTQRMITEHRKSLLAIDLREINKNILKEIMNSESTKRDGLNSPNIQTITLSAKKTFQKLSN